MTDVERAEQYRLAEALIAEQNFVNGLAAGVVASIAGAIAWGAISIATGYMIGWVAIGLGVLVGYGMQVFGKGLTAKYSAVAAVLAVVGCLGGNFAAAVMFEVKNYGVPVGDVLSTLTMRDIVAFYTETLEIMDLVFWALAVGAAWQFAPRNLTDEEGFAMRAFADRPDAGQGMIS